MKQPQALFGFLAAVGISLGVVAAVGGLSGRGVFAELSHGGSEVVGPHIALDLNPATAATDPTRNLPLGTASFQADATLGNNGAAFVLATFNVDFEHLDDSRLDAPAGVAGLDSNPDFMADTTDLPDWSCGPPNPDNDVNAAVGDPGQRSRISCFNSSGTGPPVAANMLVHMPLARITYNIPALAAAGSVGITLDNAAVFDDSFSAVLNCSWPIVEGEPCFGGTLTLGDPPTATPTTTPTVNTPTTVPATNTPTQTTVPATNTPTQTTVPATNTPTQTTVPPTNTPTQTPIPPTNTPTQTPIGPTFTPTNTPIPPTNTPTNTPAPPTNTPTQTPIVPTNTPTQTSVPATATNTPLPATATNTPLPATATNTPLPATATNTPLPPTNTPTVTNTPVVTVTNTAVATTTAVVTRTVVATVTAVPTATPDPNDCFTLGQKIRLFIGILHRWGAEEGERRYRARFDLNDDSIIDWGDLEVLFETPTCRRGFLGR